MKLRMDNSGRIVFPKPLRKRFGFEHQVEFEAVEQPDGVLLRPIARRPSMLRVGGLWIHQGVAEPGTSWQRVLDEVREERLQDVLKP